MVHDNSWNIAGQIRDQQKSQVESGRVKSYDRVVINVMKKANEMAERARAAVEWHNDRQKYALYERHNATTRSENPFENRGPLSE